MLFDLLWFLGGFLLTHQQCRQEEADYKAFVTEYRPYGNKSDLLGTLRRNVRTVTRFMEQASDANSDIAVFPEYTLFSPSIVTSRTTLKRIAQVVHPEGLELPWNPCISQLFGPNHEALRNLSCASKGNKVYSVINLAEALYCDVESDTHCPEDGVYYYNTNVVFNRKGDLIARYRKSNLYHEMLYNYPDKEAVYFDTDFGVRFGVITCFDIMWEHPYKDLLDSGIKDIVFPTAWVDQLPFFLMPQVLSGDAITSDINILASQHYAPESGALGSGIFRGRNGRHDYSYSTDSDVFVTKGNVKTRKWKDCHLGVVKTQEEDNGFSRDKELKYKPLMTIGVSNKHYIMNMDMTDMTWMKLSEKSDSITVEQNFVVCELSYEMTSLDFPGVYKLVVREGKQPIGGGAYWWFHQVCSLVYCLEDDDNLDSCSERKNPQVETNTFLKLKMAGRFERPEFVEPTVIHTNLSLFQDWKHHVLMNIHQVSLELTSPGSNLQAVTLYGRNFNKDPTYS